MMAGLFSGRARPLTPPICSSTHSCRTRPMGRFCASRDVCFTLALPRHWRTTGPSGAGSSEGCTHLAPRGRPRPRPLASGLLRGRRGRQTLGQHRGNHTLEPWHRRRCEACRRRLIASGRNSNSNWRLRPALLRIFGTRATPSVLTSEHSRSAMRLANTDAVST